MKTIKDAEEQVQGKVCEVLKQLDLLPDGYECSVRFYGESRKKKQTALLEKNWHAETDSIKIKFKPRPAAPQARRPETEQTQHTANSIAPVSSPLADLIRALDHAESRPGYKFVALKWFRDTALPFEGFPWASSDSARKSVLGEAIDNKVILTGSVPNPNSPYPTTAIRLNRLMPQVQTVLGIETRSVPDFAPVPIRGEILSSTVLRDRR
jgi:hypothetical protein